MTKLQVEIPLIGKKVHLIRSCEPQMCLFKSAIPIHKTSPMQVFVAKNWLYQCCILLDIGFDKERDEERDGISHVHRAIETRLACCLSVTLVTNGFRGNLSHRFHWQTQCHASRRRERSHILGVEGITFRFFRRWYSLRRVTFSKNAYCSRRDTA